MARIEMDTAIKNILVPTDFSPGSARALEKALLVARLSGATVTLLHVLDLNLPAPPKGPANPFKLGEELEQEGRDRLDLVVRSLADEPVKLGAILLEGRPYEQICEAARQADLIIMGKSRSSRFWRFFSRRTVELVLDKAPCPVLVVVEPRASRFGAN